MFLLLATCQQSHAARRGSGLGNSQKCFSLLVQLLILLNAMPRQVVLLFHLPVILCIRIHLLLRHI
jgi:hypothetical protein